MTPLCRQFDVVRIMIAATDNNEVLQTPGDKQLIVLQISKITRTEERSFTGIRRITFERLCRFFRPIPIALCNAGAFDPYFSDMPHRTDPQRLGVHDIDLLFQSSMPAPYQRLRLFMGFRRRKGTMLL